MEISEIAEALYEKFPAAEKERVVVKFSSMDENGDGKITFEEYIRFLDESGKSFDPELFTLFDKDNNGTLDFKELITLHYMYSTNRFVKCDGTACGNYVTGDYFSCSLCFHSDTPYKLCFCCYKNSDIVSMHFHSADNFLDNHTLLQFSRSRVLEMQREKLQVEERSQLIQSSGPKLEQSYETINRTLTVLKKGSQLATVANVLSIGSSILSAKTSLGGSILSMCALM